jgi:hypothetical protein
MNLSWLAKSTPAMHSYLARTSVCGQTMAARGYGNGYRNNNAIVHLDSHALLVAGDSAADPARLH